MANLMVSFKFTLDPPWLPWQRNLGQNGLKQQKLQKVTLFSRTLTHSQCDAGNITFCNFCCFRCASCNNKCSSAL